MANLASTGRPTNDDAPIVGRLMVSVDKHGMFQASFDSEVAYEVSQFNVAVLSLGLATEVTRSENRGKTLEHDFVVLGLSRYSSRRTGAWSGVIEKP